MLMSIVDIGVWTRNWWAVVLRGVAAIVFGLAAILMPRLSLAALVLAFGAYAFVNGVFAFVSAVRTRPGEPPWWLLALEGIAGLVAGVGTLFFPGITAVALLYVIALWALVTGGLQIATAIRLRKSISNEWLLALAGIASIGFGLLLTVFPEAGALALVMWAGVYAIVIGTVMVALGIRLRVLHGAAEPPLPRSAPPHRALEHSHTRWHAHGR
jgi:uncharacterized membrane protein HdeD (DUF308 family)